MSPPLSGLFLCGELDQAVLSATVFQLGSDPIKATGDPATVVGVLVDVKRFEQEHPFISAEVNGFSGRWVGHEWSLAVFLNGLYCKTRVKGISLAPFQQHQP